MFIAMCRSVLHAKRISKPADFSQQTRGGAGWEAKAAHHPNPSLYKGPCVSGSGGSSFFLNGGSRVEGARGQGAPPAVSIGDTGVVYLLLTLTSGGGGQEAGALVHRRRGRPQPSSPSISQVEGRSQRSRRSREIAAPAVIELAISDRRRHGWTLQG